MQTTSQHSQQSTSEARSVALPGLQPQLSAAQRTAATCRQQCVSSGEGKTNMETIPAALPEFYHVLRTAGTGGMDEPTYLTVTRKASRGSRRVNRSKAMMGVGTSPRYEAML